jgi:hypothetical protein
MTRRTDVAFVTTIVQDDDGDEIRVEPSCDGEVYVGISDSGVRLDKSGVTDLVLALQNTLSRAQRDAK